MNNKFFNYDNEEVTNSSPVLEPIPHTISKMAHQYTVDELNKEYGEAWQEIRDVNDYHVIYEIKNNGNNKYIVIGCSNMLHALKYTSDSYYEMLKENFPTQQLQEWKNSIDNAIASIKNEKSDENIDIIDVLNIETEENGISIANAGYWDSFARVTPTLIFCGTAIELCKIMDAETEIHKEVTESTERLNLMSAEKIKRLNLMLEEKINSGTIIFDDNMELLDLEMKELEAEINEQNIILGVYENKDGECNITDDDIDHRNKQINEYEIMIDKLKTMIGNDVDIYSPEFIINFNNICKEI